MQQFRSSWYIIILTLILRSFPPASKYCLHRKKNAVEEYFTLSMTCFKFILLDLLFNVFSRISTYNIIIFHTKNQITIGFLGFTASKIFYMDWINKISLLFHFEFLKLFWNFCLVFHSCSKVYVTLNIQQTSKLALKGKII